MRFVVKTVVRVTILKRASIQQRRSIQRSYTCTYVAVVYVGARLYVECIVDHPSDCSEYCTRQRLSLLSSLLVFEDTYHENGTSSAPLRTTLV